MLSKRGSAVVDARTNTLFVQDTPSRLEEVRKLIAKIDVPVRQVMIEARIVEANENFNKNLGAKLGYNRLDTNGRSVPLTGERSSGAALRVRLHAWQRGSDIPWAARRASPALSRTAD